MSGCEFLQEQRLTMAMKAGRLFLIAIAALAASPSLFAFTEEKGASKPFFARVHSEGRLPNLDGAETFAAISSAKALTTNQRKSSSNCWLRLAAGRPAVIWYR